MIKNIFTGICFLFLPGGRIGAGREIGDAGLVNNSFIVGPLVGDERWGGTQHRHLLYE